LYGYETWSVTFGEEQKVRVIKNRALRRIFGDKGLEITREWRGIYKEGLNDL
jgi:hypothetical protein